MKLTKSQFVKLIKESYTKQKTRQLTEVDSPETQGKSFSQKELGALAADVKSMLKQINNRIQGKMEFNQFARICLEFLLDFKTEGASETDLFKAAKGVAGESQGRRLFNLLKIVAKERGESLSDDDEALEQEEGSPANRSDLEEGKYDSLNKAQDKAAIEGIISMLEEMELDQKQKKALEALKSDPSYKAARNLFTSITGRSPLSDLYDWV